MTVARTFAMRAAMRKSWLFILCLIASSLVVTTTVHAREWISETALECSGAVHSDGDADQTQGDSDKAAPHHHGSCHGQFAAVASDASVGGEFASRIKPVVADASKLRPRGVDPAPRPPAA